MALIETIDFGEQDDEAEISDFQKELRGVDPAKIKEMLLDNMAYDDALGMWVILSYSDYTGGAAERSNTAYMLKKYTGIVTADHSDTFNAVTVGIHQEDLDKMDAAALHALYLDLKTIRDEGVIDETSYKQVQVEKIVEAWVNWVAKNFKHELVQKFPQYSDQLDAMARGIGKQLWKLFDEAQGISGEEWSEEKGADQTINVEKVSNAVTQQMLERWMNWVPQANPQVESLLEGKKFSCVMAPAPPEISDAVLRWGKMFIGEDELYLDQKDPDGFGREDDVHVTVKFGLHEAEPSEELLRVIEETQPFEIEVGPCTLFDTNDQYDVVKFDVDGDGLREFNRRVSELPNSDEHPEYHPHMTVAYVTKGCCHELIGKPLLDPASDPDLRFLVKAVTFSSPNSTKTTLFLGKPNLEEARKSQSLLGQYLKRPHGGSSEMVHWSLDQAEAWLNPLIPQLRRAGYSAEIVGSVATRGESDKDLDVLLVPAKGRHNVAAAVAVLAANSKAFGHADEDVFNAILPDGRIVEFWFGDLQDLLNAEENPYTDEAIEMPEGFLYAGGLAGKSIGEDEQPADDEEMDIEMAKDVYGVPEGSFKRFTDADVEDFGGSYVRIFADRTDLIDAPLDWQKRGLQQTASGYGAKLTTRYKIAFNDKVYRLYATAYGNASTVWFKNKGRTIVVG